MGFRYRRSKKIAPGIRMNISKSGPSFTVGGKHAHTTVGHGRVTNSVRTPIKGLRYSNSFSSKISKNSKSQNNSATGCLGLIGLAIAFYLIIAIGAIAISLAIIAGPLYIAYTYYKANTLLDPDQVERLASVIYQNEPNKKYSAWTVYLKSKRLLKTLNQDISQLEDKSNAFDGEDVSELCQILKERENKYYQIQAINEIFAEPEFLKPVTDIYFSKAIKDYLNRTFNPVYFDAMSLKTERGKKNRYKKYFERFDNSLFLMPIEAREVLYEYMADNGIEPPYDKDVDEKNNSNDKTGEEVHNINDLSKNLGDEIDDTNMRFTTDSINVIPQNDKVL